MDAFLESEVPSRSDATETDAPAPTGRRRRRAAEEPEQVAAEATEASGGTGRRRGRPAEDATGGQDEDVAEGAVVTAAEHAAGTAAVGSGLGGTVPPQGVPVPTGRRARRDGGEAQAALPPALPAPSPAPETGAEPVPADRAQPGGRRRRALAAAAERAAAQEAGARTVFALPPAEADRSPGSEPTPVPVADGTNGQVPAPVPVPVPAQMQAPVPSEGAPGDDGRHDAVPHDQAEDHTPPQPHPTSAPTGRRRRAVAQSAEMSATPAQGVPAQGVPAQGVPAQGVPAQGVPAQGVPAQGVPAQGVPAQGVPAQGVPAQGVPAQGVPAQGVPAQGTVGQALPLPAEAAPAAPVAPAAQATPAPGTPIGAAAVSPNGTDTPGAGTPLPPEHRAAQPLPAEAAAPVDPNSTQGRAISVRTLGQGVPFSRQAAQVQQPTPTPPPQTPGGSGRRRKLGTPPDPAARQEQRQEQGARPHPPTTEQPPAQPSLAGQSLAGQTLAGQSRLAPATTEGAGRSYAIGAPDENAAEGPEPLDGPGGAIEVADPPRPQPMDDELPPEPLDNPRRLLVWPAPDVTTQQALSDRGYRPVIVHSREEVDAQIAAFPAALFVDPLTGPITRTALQSLRQAAVAAEVPVLVTAGLGQATREAAYGADPAVLLKALAPRDSEQHPPRVLLIEEHAEIALALTSTLERRGMQVARAASDADAVTLAGQLRPNLVVMDLMQVHRRQAGIVDWLRANGQLNRTPIVVYTAAVDQADLPRLASGETVLFLAERSTSGEVQGRIVDLLSRIGTN
ncbi:response regulator [Streptomyces sp. HUAS TT20]|uniref:response regulator n=1 Tax=Streptomyces sp. HUAS TT20 TaxID=3447509 RepID=UPI0039860311